MAGGSWKQNPKFDYSVNSQLTVQRATLQMHCDILCGSVKPAVHLYKSANVYFFTFERRHYFSHWHPWGNYIIKKWKGTCEFSDFILIGKRVNLPKNQTKPSREKKYWLLSAISVFQRWFFFSPCRFGVWVEGYIFTFKSPEKNAS